MRELFLDHARLAPHDPHKRVADQTRLIRAAMRQPHLTRQTPDLHHNPMRLTLDPDQPIPQTHFRRPQPQLDLLRLPLPTTLRRSTPHYRTSTGPRAGVASTPRKVASDTDRGGAARFRRRHRTGSLDSTAVANRACEALTQSNDRTSGSCPGQDLLVPDRTADRDRRERRYFSWW